MSSKRAIKVAIVRGSNMNPYEMQSYAPLASGYELTGYAGVSNNFELDGIGFPVKKLRMFEDRYRFLPSPARGLVYGLMLPRGLNSKMYGLEEELQDKGIIHTAETYTGYSYQAARIKREKKKKLAITVWENIPFLSTHLFRGFDGIPFAGEALRSRLTENDHIVRYVKENADLLIAVTERAKSALMIEGTPEDKIRVVPVGVDTGRFKPAAVDPSIRRSIGISDDDFMVLFIGRLTMEKGIYDLLYAASIMSKDVELKHARIVLAGTGPEKKNIESLIRKLGLEKVVILAGSFPYSQVPSLYNAADAFILPSIPVPFWQEQFGMVLVEAMASGLPVISTMSGSIPEVVGDAGILVQPGDPLSVYNAIRSLASDRGVARQLSRNARKRAEEKFGIDEISKAIGSIYDELA
jgi:glycosyltransferase involved in cell wall biosynthesis